MYWFYSDPHFYHKNIIKYTNRPFDNVLEMNEIIIDNHNKCVGNKDHVVCLGDFSFSDEDKTVEILK